MNHLQRSAMRQWLAAGIILLGISCRKDHGPRLPPPPDKLFDIITTGVEIESQGLYYDAYYWINDKRFPLEKGTAVEAFPYGIEKVGNDLYIAGMHVPANGTSLPCYWVNGVKKDLPVDGLNINQRCGARDVIWFNNALYILGDVDLHPVIWKVKGNTITIIEVKSTSTLQQEFAASMNLEAYNNQLYFGSAAFVTAANGNSWAEAGYWTMGTDDKTTFHTLESNIQHVLCYSLAVSGKGVFIAGEYQEGNTIPKPAVWTHQGRMEVVKQVNENFQRINEVELNSKGNMYLNVLDYHNTKPLVWEVSGNTYEPLSATIPATAAGYCNNLAVHDDMLAYAYTYIVGSNYNAGYVFNGKQVELQTGSAFLTIHRTSIFPK